MKENSMVRKMNAHTHTYKNIHTYKHHGKSMITVSKLIAGQLSFNFFLSFWGCFLGVMSSVRRCYKTKLMYIDIVDVYRL